MANDLNNDLEALNLASAAVTAISARYRTAAPEEQSALWEARDSAWTAYASARQRLLQHGALVSDEQLDSIRDLRDTLSVTAETANVARAAQQLVQVLGRISLI